LTLPWWQPLAFARAPRIGDRQEIAMLLKVEKMTCNHCVRSVTNAVKTVDPQAVVTVDLPRQEVRVEAEADAEAVAAAIREEGYTAEVMDR